MTQGKIETLKHTGADRRPQLFQPFGLAAHAVHQLLQTPFVLLFDHLAIDQIWMGLFERLCGTPPLFRASKDLYGMVDLDQSRQVTVNGYNPGWGPASLSPWAFVWVNPSISSVCIPKLIG